MNILIAVTAYGGSIKNGCARALLGLQPALERRGVSFQIEIADVSNVALVRNYFATKMLGSDHTHLLFIDSDMEFRPQAVLRELQADKELIGCAYSRRQLDLQSALTASKSMDVETAVALSSEFTVRFEGPRDRISVKDGVCEVDDIGMGVTLIRKDCLAALEHRVAKIERPVYGLKHLLGFFDPIEGAPYAEDWAFCRRWRQTGGKVWAIVDEDIGHIGDFTYRGSYTARLKAGKL